LFGNILELIVLILGSLFDIKPNSFLDNTADLSRPTMPEWFNFTISLLIPEESLTEANLEPILIQANTDNLVSTA